MKQFEVGNVLVRKRNRLPHWVVDHAPYLVTWNLRDAIPEDVTQGLRREYEFELRRIRMMRGSVTAADRAQLELSIRRKVEKVLDEGHGECVLRNRECAGIVADSLEHFNGERYDLSTMSVMPNHVHVIFSCREGHTIDKIVDAWKGFTSKQINQVLGRSGHVWQEDYFDRTLRSDSQFERALTYVQNNPSRAGLIDWEFVRTYPNAIAKVLA